MAPVKSGRFLSVSTCGKLLGILYGWQLVCKNTDANFDKLSDIAKVDPEGTVRLHSTLEAAYAAATTNQNDVILLDG